jgi:hypothetical protein
VDAFVLADEFRVPIRGIPHSRIFGASAPAPVLMREYGFTVENICKRALALLDKIKGKLTIDWPTVLWSLAARGETLLSHQRCPMHSDANVDN